jgi:hypothetical protein
VCEPYNPTEMRDMLFNIRMEVLNGDKHEANRMLVSLIDVICPYQEEEEEQCSITL